MRSEGVRFSRCFIARSVPTARCLHWLNARPAFLDEGGHHENLRPSPIRIRFRRHFGDFERLQQHDRQRRGAAHAGELRRLEPGCRPREHRGRSASVSKHRGLRSRIRMRLRSRSKPRHSPVYVAGTLRAPLDFAPALYAPGGRDSCSVATSEVSSWASVGCSMLGVYIILIEPIAPRQADRTLVGGF